MILRNGQRQCHAGGRCAADGISTLEFSTQSIETQPLLERILVQIKGQPLERFPPSGCLQKQLLACLAKPSRIVTVSVTHHRPLRLSPPYAQ